MADCYACTVAEKHPATQLRGHADCLGCDARAIAHTYGGLPPDTVSEVMTKAWPDTKTFRQGRSLFWYWHRAIEQAKADKEQQ